MTMLNGKQQFSSRLGTFFNEKYWYFSYFSMKTYVVGTHYSGTSIIQRPRDQIVLFELLRLWIIEG